MSDDPGRCPTNLADCSARNNAKQVHGLPALYPYAVLHIRESQVRELFIDFYGRKFQICFLEFDKLEFHIRSKFKWFYR